MATFASYDYRLFLLFLLIKMSSLQSCVPFAYDLPQNTSSWPPPHAPPASIHTRGHFLQNHDRLGLLTSLSWIPRLLKMGRKTLQIWSNLIIFLSTEARKREVIFPCYTGSWEQLFHNSVWINRVHPVQLMDCFQGSITLCLVISFPWGIINIQSKCP